MTVEWTLNRRAADDETHLGILDTDTGATCYTLEHTSVEIPVGRYQLLLTESGRAKRGELWTPDSRFRLPEVMHVPNRAGIRMHAGNVYQNSVGCILVGSEIDGLSLEHSRPALIRVWNMLADAEANSDLVFLTIKDHGEVRHD